VDSRSSDARPHAGFGREKQLGKGFGKARAQSLGALNFPREAARPIAVVGRVGLARAQSVRARGRVTD